MIDTHAHIYSKKFESDRAQMMQSAFDAGISRIYMPNVDSESIDDMLALEAAYPNQCFAMMGLHPCSVNEHFEKELKIVEDWLQQRPFVGIGEMGLDLYWDKTFFAQQQESFRIHAGWARQYGRPLIIHTRNSMPETIAMLEELQHDELFGVVHCFTGTLDDAKRIIDLGFMLGIGGVATFKNGGLDLVLPHIGLSHVVLETDSPYLAPNPFRGKRNEPSYIKYVLERVAELTGYTASQAEQLTDANALRLFGLQH